METYPNQDVVEIKKEPCDKNNLYATINLKASQLAAKDLTYA